MIETEAREYQGAWAGFPNIAVSVSVMYVPPVKGWPGPNGSLGWPDGYRWAIYRDDTDTLLFDWNDLNDVARMRGSLHLGPDHLLVPLTGYSREELIALAGAAPDRRPWWRRTLEKLWKNLSKS